MTLLEAEAYVSLSRCRLGRRTHFCSASVRACIICRCWLRLALGAFCPCETSHALSCSCAVPSSYVREAPVCRMAWPSRMPMDTLHVVRSV